MLRMIGRAVGMHRSTDASAAADALRLAFAWLLRPHWNYLLVRGTDIALVDATGLAPTAEGYRGWYSLPYRIRDFYTLKVGYNLTGDQRPTLYVDFIDYALSERYLQNNPASGGLFFTTRAGYQSDQFQLIPQPSAAGVAEVVYFRRMNIPVQDTDVLDVMEGPMENALAMYGGSIMAQWDGKTARRSRDMRSEAEMARREAMGLDKSAYGELLEEIPQAVWARRRIAVQSPNAAYPQYANLDWEN